MNKKYKAFFYISVFVVIVSLVGKDTMTRINFALLFISLLLIKEKVPHKFYKSMAIILVLCISFAIQFIWLQ